ncbi:hypothetical protein SAMN02800694_0415 [Luteibacter sp. UNCMF331Sha3.1]|uniref:hypothetical protein n=1 Tax=Luteibacter sp. UNCMF331Sha3.1 TaxID=1502760 RepID=UPI0008CDB27C|nr:hypothetical protein [Luteibacter sp. UNCMF331Sha3.1]SEM26119.1 hypothetical protein SAMN02800694_0415 [Luteibacter sp. UNCMF331Sha3.1]
METGRSIAPFRWTAFPLLFLPSIAFSAETKDFSPPSLNPHPKETLHVTVSFDRPEDGKRYAIVMKALYQNQQSECGYVEPGWNRRFIYPKATYDIPNMSRNSRVAVFDIYLDRYKRDTCNWELAKPQVRVRDADSGTDVVVFWGMRESLSAGTEYRAICPFRRSDHALRCFSNEEKVPDTTFYSDIPDSRRIPITIRVSADSAPLHSPLPSHFSKSVEPMPSDAAPIARPAGSNNQ